MARSQREKSNCGKSRGSAHRRLHTSDAVGSEAHPIVADILLSIQANRKSGTVMQDSVLASSLTRENTALRSPQSNQTSPRGRGAIGSASDLHSEGCGFDSRRFHYRS